MQGMGEVSFIPDSLRLMEYQCPFISESNLSYYFNRKQEVIHDQKAEEQEENKTNLNGHNKDVLLNWHIYVGHLPSFHFSFLHQVEV